MLHSDLRAAADHLAIELPTLMQAALRSQRMMDVVRERLRTRLSPENSPFDVVVLGSLARFEVSDESDFDFLIVAHRRPGDPQLSRRLLEAVEDIRESELGLEGPGATRLFGGVVSAPDLTERIGLEQDTNRTHTQRILILEESRSVFCPDLHRDLLRAIVERYLLDAEVRDEPVPRFLLNDILRYWRTLAVDYEAKRWEGLEQNWGLRYLKLRISRKIAFAGTLISVLTCPGSERLQDHLVEEFLKPPLARFAQIHARLDPRHRKRLREVLEIAERFASRLEDRDFRAHARSVSSRRELEENEATREARQEARRLQAALEAIFFDSELLRERSRRYLSF